tara:strand:- start:562 stop:828 length:267 start_codon:yes stop_codon:yes gene_type:complete
MLDNNDNQEIEDEISPPPLSQFDKELVNDNLFLNSNHNSKTARSLTISIILVIIVLLMIFVIMSQFQKNISTEIRNLEMNPKDESSQL